MRKVNGYVARHRKQRPSGDVSDTPWRYSLMNWGHDPLSERRQTGSGPGSLTVRSAKLERTSVTCGSWSNVSNSSRS